MLSAPDVISVARLVPTLPAPDVTIVKTLPAPLVTSLATLVATDSTVEAIPVPIEAAPEVMTEIREESWADARGAATRGRRRAEVRIVRLVFGELSWQGR